MWISRRYVEKVGILKLSQGTAHWLLANHELCTLNSLFPLCHFVRMILVLRNKDHLLCQMTFRIIMFACTLVGIDQVTRRFWTERLFFYIAIFFLCHIMVQHTETYTPKCVFANGNIKKMAVWKQCNQWVGDK